jgi:uncharacterized membrane protein
LCVLGGFTGSIIDSILGATVQVKYYCEEPGYITEKRMNKGSTNKIISGFPIITNDVVNFASGFISSLLTISAYVLLSR